MKRSIVRGCVCAAVLLIGCVPSLHELYTEETLIFDEGLLGTWKGEDVWHFEPDGEDGYLLTIVQDEAGKPQDGRFTAKLVNMDGRRYMDWFPVDEAICEDNDYLRFNWLPMHTFVKLEATDPNLVVCLMDPEKVRDLLKEKPEMVKHEVRDGRVILTASTAELQEFLRNPAADRAVWSEAHTLERVKGTENRTKHTQSEKKN